MLLRRISAHVKAQNWTAIAIDFVIVVVGVFVGIQVANWNDVQNNKAGLAASLERLDNEVSRNINLIDDVLDYYEDSAIDYTVGRSALNNCTFTPEAEAAFERLMFDLVKDVHPNFSFVAVNQLASQDRYQDLLSPEFQQAFGFYAARLNEEHEQLTSHYDNLWSRHVNYHPAVTAFFGSDSGNSDEYKDWSFELDRPFSEICNDASFRNRFINTIGFYTAINRRLTTFKEEAKAFQQALTEERGRL